jgi:indole-3-acetate monooxygenase
MPTERTTFLDEAQSISDIVRADADTAERQAGLTNRVVGALRDTGLYWMLVPHDLGGGGADLHAALDVIESLSFDDGATGWSFMANAATTGYAGAFVSDVAAEQMFGRSQLGLTAGMLGPAGRASMVPGGLHGGGHYSFGSGCAQADWMGAGMLIMEGGAPVMRTDGTPLSRICYLRRQDVEFVANWDVSGLSATGSHDYVIDDRIIANDFTIDGALVTSDEPWRGGDLYRIGLIGFVTVSHAAFALGIMKRALQEIAEIATTKKRMGYPTTVADNDIFRSEFAIQEANYRAAHSYCHQLFDNLQQTAYAGFAPDETQVARLRAATTWVTQTAVTVVQFAHLWAGSNAIRNPTALGRCTRDIHVATQHMIVDPATMAQFAPPLIASWRTDTSMN